MLTIVALYEIFNWRWQMSHGILINGTDDIATIQDDWYYYSYTKSLRGFRRFINEHFRRFIWTKVFFFLYSLCKMI
jgi:hypothetical protein